MSSAVQNFLGMNKAFQYVRSSVSVREILKLQKELKLRNSVLICTTRWKKRGMVISSYQTPVSSRSAEGDFSAPSGPNWVGFDEKSTSVLSGSWSHSKKFRSSSSRVSCPL
jgi:hypothetical protein